MAAVGIRKRAKTYSYRIRIKDKITGEPKDIERSGFKTEKEAKLARAEMLTLLTKGEVDLQKEKSLVEDVFSKYIKEKDASPQIAHNTTKRYRCLFKYHLAPIWGKRKITSVDPEELYDYLEELIESSLSYSYIEGIHRFYRSLWSFASDEGYLRKNIARKIKMPERDVDDVDEPIYTYSNELLDLLEERITSTNLLPSLKTGRATGTRCGETFGFRWSCIDWEKRQIKVIRQLVRQRKMWVLKTPKSRSSIRTLDMDDELYNYMKLLKEEQDKYKEEYGKAYKYTKVFLDQGKKKGLKLIPEEEMDFIFRKPDGELLTPHSIKVISRIAKKELGFDFKFHGLRHTHCCRLIALGVKFEAVRMRMGHAKEETTRKYYTHMNDELRRDVVDKLNESNKEKVESVEQIMV